MSLLNVRGTLKTVIVLSNIITVFFMTQYYNFLNNFQIYTVYLVSYVTTY